VIPQKCRAMLRAKARDAGEGVILISNFVVFHNVILGGFSSNRRSPISDYQHGNQKLSQIQHSRRSPKSNAIHPTCHQTPAIQKPSARTKTRLRRPMSQPRRVKSPSQWSLGCRKLLFEALGVNSYWSNARMAGKEAVMNPLGHFLIHSDVLVGSISYSLRWSVVREEIANQRMGNSYVLVIDDFTVHNSGFTAKEKNACAIGSMLNGGTWEACSNDRFDNELI
jgi:hypothetical protein